MSADGLAPSLLALMVNAQPVEPALSRAERRAGVIAADAFQAGDSNNAKTHRREWRRATKGKPRMATKR